MRTANNKYSFFWHRNMQGFWTQYCTSLLLPFQFVGHYDEILDLAFVGDKDSMLAVATNSPGIKVIDIDTLDCRILTGHSGEDDDN